MAQDGKQDAGNPLNGVSIGLNRLLILLLLPLIFGPANSCETGIASQYSPGLMQAVIRNRTAGITARNLPIYLPQTDGYVAVLDCNQIGQLWHIAYMGRVETFLVVDCAGDERTRQWMVRNRILVEVDYETAQRWQVIGRAAKPIWVCKNIDYWR